MKLIKEAFNNNNGWEKTWKNPTLKKRIMTFLIIGGGGHGLATAFYLASEFKEKNCSYRKKEILVLAMLEEIQQ